MTSIGSGSIPRASHDHGFFPQAWHERDHEGKGRPGSFRTTRHEWVDQRRKRTQSRKTATSSRSSWGGGAQVRVRFRRRGGRGTKPLCRSGSGHLPRSLGSGAGRKERRCEGCMVVLSSGKGMSIHPPGPCSRFIRTSGDEVVSFPSTGGMRSPVPRVIVQCPERPGSTCRCPSMPTQNTKSAWISCQDRSSKRRGRRIQLRILVADAWTFRRR